MHEHSTEWGEFSPCGLIITPLLGLFAPLCKKPQASPLFVVAFSILATLDDIFLSLLFQ